MAALLAGRTGKQEAPPPKPVAQIETVEILVARSDIGMGQVVSGGDIEWQIWPKSAASQHFLRKSERPDAIQNLTGSIARSPFVGGEPIRESKLIKADGSGFMAALIPSGMRAISTEISPETGAGGFILPNDRVDVILSRRSGGDSDKATDTLAGETLFTNVRVLAIDQTVEEKGGQKVVVGKTATLELAPRQAEVLAQARQQGTLTLALRSLVDARGSPSDRDEDDGSSARGSRINMVRFGIGTTVVRK